MIGGLGRADLTAALDRAGVQLNALAISLLESEAFEFSTGERAIPIALSVGELGFTDGAQLHQILDAGQTRGLWLWPLIAAPYLRLATLDQGSAPDAIMSSGRAPSGSITVASRRPRPDDDAYPAGFYLRVIDGAPWLRGYRCSHDYLWPSTAQFMFRRP